MRTTFFAAALLALGFAGQATAALVDNGPALVLQGVSINGVGLVLQGTSAHGTASIAVEGITLPGQPELALSR